ncbi:MAG: hypothetical protein EAZ80_13755, partial [Runella slithyformis]
MNQVVLIYRADICPQKWAELTLQCPYAMFYHQLWYLDTVAEHLAAIVCKNAQGYEWVFPLPFRYKFGFKTVYQPLFIQHLGFIGTVPPSEQQILNIENLIKQHFFYVASYQGSLDTYLSETQGFSNAFILQTHRTHHLNLNQSYELLRANFRRDRRRELKNQDLSMPRFEYGQNIEPLIALFERIHAKQINGGVSQTAYALLQKIYEVLSEKKLTRLYYGLSSSHEIVSGALFVQYGSYITYLFNAALPDYRHENHRLFFLNREIEDNAGKPLFLDFESAQEPKIADYYASFGAESQPFAHLHYNNLPAP